MKTNKLLLFLFIFVAGCHCTCDFDMDNLLAELDRRCAERQQQWEMCCQLQWQPVWWSWEQQWQWPFALQWRWQYQPSLYCWRWSVPVNGFAEIQGGASECVESGPGPESVPGPESAIEREVVGPVLEIYERDAVRRLSQSYIKTGREEYDKGYFEQAINAFYMARKYQKYLNVTEREKLDVLIKKTEAFLEGIQYE